MPKKVICRKRKARRKEFSDFSLMFEMYYLIKGYLKDKKYIPSMMDIKTLEEHGWTFEEFKKNIKYFKKLYDKAVGVDATQADYK